MLWLITIVVISLLAVRRWNIQKLLEFSKEIKCGIKSYPLIGHAYLFAGDSENRMTSLQKFGRDAIKNGGMTQFWIGSTFYVVAVDPIDIELILNTCLEKDDVMRFARNLIGNGLIFAPVPIWRPRRKVSAPTFSLNNLNRFVKIFAGQSDIMVKQVESVLGVGAESMWKYMTKYTFYSVCETALGVKLNSEEKEKKVVQKILESFDNICKLVAARSLQPWLQPDAIYKLLPFHNTFEKHKKILYQFVNEVIKSVRTNLKGYTKKHNANNVTSFLELLIETSGGDRGYSDQELLEEALVMLLAGTDTSATGMCFTMCMLANHPDVQDKVFQELQKVFGDSDRPVVHEDLPRLKYLEAVIRETLRLYPPIPVIVRKSSADTKLPSGVTLRKGCGVLIHIWATHRNPVYWGEDAELFRPERFFAEPLKHPAAFLAFSHGPRSCLGFQYSMMSLKTALATFLRKYCVLSKYENRESGTVNHESMKLKYDLMMKDVDEFQVRLVERKKDKVF